MLWESAGRHFGSTSSLSTPLHLAEPLPSFLLTFKGLVFKFGFEDYIRESYSQLLDKMGANLSKAMGKIFGNKEMRLLMLGLDAAGKTSAYTVSPNGCQGTYGCGQPFSTNSS